MYHDDVTGHLRGCIFHENAFALQLHEELASGQVLEDQVEFVASLEGVHQVNDERVLRVESL